MALFGKSSLPIEEVRQLRMQGYSDNQVIDELREKGYSLPQINNALAQVALASPQPADLETGSEDVDLNEYSGPPQPPAFPEPSATPAELAGRIEEIAESIIDEKWDLLIEEVKKVVEWKSKVEEDLSRLKSDLEKLKDDFKELHQGVLGKLESYDERMTEVGTELKAVGNVFRDVIPEFVENVKELKAVTKGVKGKK